MRAEAQLIHDGHDASANLLERLPAATFLIDPEGLIAAANGAARQLMTPIDGVGLSLAAAFGLAGATAGELSALSNEAARVRIQLADGRVIDLRATAMDGAGRVVCAFDVSSYVRDAELGAMDALTGLLNRAGFSARLQEALSAAERSAQTLAVLYIDLDRFKNVNDTLGHPIGDALLAKVADRLRSAILKGDVIGRLGGDEFAVIQRSGEQPLAAESLAARLVDLLGRTYVISGHSITIGASIGVTIGTGAGGAASEHPSPVRRRRTAPGLRPWRDRAPSRRASSSGRRPHLCRWLRQCWRRW